MAPASDRPRCVEQRVRDAGYDEALLRECWRFRLSLIDLQPDVPPEDDWQAFRAYFRPGVRLEVWRERRTGAIQAMFAWSMRQVRDGPRTHVVIDADYGFVAPGQRRRATALTLPRIWLAAAWAGRSLDVALVGSGYPAGVMGFGRHVRRIRSLVDPDLEPWELEVLRAYCAEADCIDAARGVVRMRTRPREARREPRSARSRALLAWYEAQVPRWQEGQGLVYVVRFEPLHLLRGLLLGR